MTSSRVYRRQAMSPATALRFIIERGGTHCDLTLVTLFVTCIGIIPIGSVGEHESSTLAVVLQPSASLADSEHPVVKIIANAVGEPLDDGPDLDLTAKDETGRYRDCIIRLINHIPYQFDTNRYYLRSVPSHT
ncbi:MAG: hypothetical protein ACK4VP_04620 [Nitrospira sp.]